MPMPIVPGMLDDQGRRFVGAKDGKPMWATIHYVKSIHNGVDLVTNDPATTGCALFVVRKLYNDPYTSTQYIDPETEPTIKEHGILRAGWVLIGKQGLLANLEGMPLWHHTEFGVLRMAAEMSDVPVPKPLLVS